MNIAAIKKLDQLNQDFYQQYAAGFDQTRHYAWSGWKQLVPKLNTLGKDQESLSILDIGCGNARFAQFLAKHHQNFSYYGVDNNQKLLTTAKKNLIKLANSHHKIKFEFQKLNLVSSLLNDTFRTKIKKQFDLITVFGVLHHIPSFKLRIKFITEFGKLLKNKDALLVITAWQFAQQQRFQDKIIDPKKINIKTKELETNDYFLDWKNQTDYPRYCHFINQTELKQMQQQIADLSLTETFTADGQDNNLNLYLIWKLT